MAEQMTARLRAYRAYVARVARGEPLPSNDGKDAARALQHLGLPPFAWQRDVRAYREAATSQGHRLEELRVLHPHLFDEPEAWVENRTKQIARRRRAVAR